MTRLMFAAILLAMTPALAQDVRGPNGQLLYRYSHEGDRTVQRDPTGRMMSYSQRSGDHIDIRDPTGRLIAKESLPRR